MAWRHSKFVNIRCRVVGYWWLSDRKDLFAQKPPLLGRNCMQFGQISITFSYILNMSFLKLLAASNVSLSQNLFHHCWEKVKKLPIIKTWYSNSKGVWSQKGRYMLMWDCCCSLKYCCYYYYCVASAHICSFWGIIYPESFGLRMDRRARLTLSSLS